MSKVKRSDPALWERSKAKARKKLGGHSARAMQLAVKLYKDAGGKYKTPKRKDNSLAKWSRQKWQWSGARGGPGVYLPKAKIKRLKSSKAGRAKLAKAAKVKARATREGRQYARHGLAAGTKNPPERTLFERFGHLSAPAPGQKGFRPPIELGEKAFDGRDPYEVAETMLTNARRLNNDPDLLSIIDPEWLAAMFPDAAIDVDLDEQADIIAAQTLPDLLDTPLYGPVRPMSPIERSNFAHFVLDMAAKQRGGELEGPLAGALRYQEPLEVPDWVVTASLVDQMVLEDTKPRLVPVTKREAYDFVKRHHSKLGGGFKLPPGLIYAIGLQKGFRLAAVALVNSPTAQWRRTDPRNIIELTRIASDGTVRNAASMLAARAIDLLPLSKRGNPDEPSLFITYSLVGEKGTPYKALRQKGLRPTAYVKGGAPRGARRGGAGLAQADKIRWEAGPAAAPGNWELLVEQIPLFAMDNPPLKAPARVRRTAEKALQRRRARARRTSRPGGTAVGIARARDLANNRALSKSSLKRMRSFFARHDTPAEQRARARDKFSPASIAWDLWGGDAGRAWVNSLELQ